MTRSIALALAVFLFAGDHASAKESDRQSKETFRWSGKSRDLYLRNLNGPIEVTGIAAGNEIEVVGIVSWKKSDPSHVRIETHADDDSVTICALFPTKGKKATCGVKGEYQTVYAREEDLEVSLQVKLPRGTRLDVQTTNGALTVNGLDADARVRTVNGRVDVSQESGRLKIEAVNGSVSVTSTAAKGDVAVATVNGAITIDVPDEAGAQVQAQTANGSIQIGGHHVSRSKAASHTFGKGSRRVVAETMNGAITVM